MEMTETLPLIDEGLIINDPNWDILPGSSLFLNQVAFKSRNSRDYAPVDWIAGESVLPNCHAFINSLSTRDSDLDNLVSDSTIPTITSTIKDRLTGLGELESMSSDRTVEAIDPVFNNSSDLNRQASIQPQFLIGEPIVFPSDAGILNVKDFGAKGDGHTDDTGAIQAALNAFPNGKRIIYLPNGTYLISRGATSI